MKRFYAFTYKIGIGKLLFLCLLIGVVLGAVVSNLFRGFFIDQFFLFDDSYINTLKTEELNHFVIFQMALIRHMKEFGLLCLLTTTMFGIPVFMFHVGYKGFSIGFIVSTAVMRYGMKGILFVLGYLFPHYLLLIPLYIILYFKGYEVNYRLYSKSVETRVRFANYIPYLFILIALIVVASFFEGYVNTSLLKKL